MNGSIVLQVDDEEKKPKKPINIKYKLHFCEMMKSRNRNDVL